jgi:two-component system, OmpR family, response regulator
MKKILLVDDDIELTGMLARYLKREQFEVETAHDGESGVRLALQGGHALIVLDVMMPRLSGMEALRRIRASRRTPVIMLTARGDNVDRIVGLDMGADDYVPKPCTPGELVARIRAVLRRTDPPPEAEPPPLAADVIEAGLLAMWPGRREATWRGQPLPLTGTEFVLLLTLARHAGQLMPKADISLQALGRPLTPYDRRIDVHLSSVRQKLGLRADGQPWIQSVRGLGYQLLKD